MSIFYSDSLKQFFDTSIFPGDQLPGDVIEVTPDEARSILADLHAAQSKESEVALTAEVVQQLRRHAYREESDSLKLEAEHDALINGTDPDYTAWLAKVAEIKERYPFTDQ